MGTKWQEQASAVLAAYKLNEIRATGILPGGGEKFFPVIGYPPLTMFSDMGSEQLFAGIDSVAAKKTVAYVHIPFCPSRCTFCHWITKTKSKEDEVNIYLDYLEQEMRLYRQLLRVDKLPAQSVLIGGGTPTYLNAKQMERFMTMMHENYELSTCTQFSMEAEPKTLLGPDGKAKLQIMADMGVDRVSLGVQSFDDNVLAYMGRVHNHADTLESIEAMRKAGIGNIMIDLIYAYPGLTLDKWEKTMLDAVELDIEGYQLYRLRIRKHGDRQGNIISQYEKNPDKFPSVDDIYLMKQLGIEISRSAGFEERQTRIFAKKAQDISHYLQDWCCDLSDVIGVGVSSWSNLRGRFSLNVGDTSLASYYNYIDQSQIPINRGKVRSVDDERRRNFILPLKNNVVDKNKYAREMGVSVYELYGNIIRAGVELGLLDDGENILQLTNKGKFFADEVATQFFDPDYFPYPEVSRLGNERVA